MAKTKAQILQDIVGDVIAETDQITYFGKDGVARGLLNAVSNTLVEAWTDIFQTKRGLHITTSAGNDLDLLAARWGLTRLTTRKSSVVLLLNGTATTVIPANTIIVSSINSSVQYQTLKAITLGATNPDIQRPVSAESIGDIGKLCSSRRCRKGNSKNQEGDETSLWCVWQRRRRSRQQKWLEI